MLLLLVVDLLVCRFVFLNYSFLSLLLMLTTTFLSIVLGLNRLVWCLDDRIVKRC